MLFSLIRSSHLDLIHHWSCVMRVHCSCLLRVCCSSPCNWFCLHFCLCFTWRAVSMDVSSLFNVYCILPCDLSMVALCTHALHMLMLFPLPVSSHMLIVPPSLQHWVEPHSGVLYQLSCHCSRMGRLLL